jgi:hypothetical protein
MRAIATAFAIVQKLLDPATAGSCEFRMLYVAQDRFLGVRDAEGRLRTVIPAGPLQTQVCRFFHDEAGHPGVQRTLQAVTRYFCWPNMRRFITRFVTSCSACQASKGSNRLPAGFAGPHVLPNEPAAEWSVDFVDEANFKIGSTCAHVKSGGFDYGVGSGQSFCRARILLVWSANGDSL